MIEDFDVNQTKAFYDRISSAYDLIADSSEHAARERGIELLGASFGEQVLVVGFGTGHSVLALAQAVGPTGKVHGVDISEGMLAVADKRITEAGMADRVELGVGDARHLIHENGRFDAVFLAFTLELFDHVDIPGVLGEIHRVLRRDGRLVIVAMSKDGHDSIMTTLYGWAHRRFPHWVDCRPIPVADCLQQSQFRTVRTERLSIWGLPVDIAVAKPLSE